MRNNGFGLPTLRYDEPPRRAVHDRATGRWLTLLLFAAACRPAPAVVANEAASVPAPPVSRPDAALTALEGVHTDRVGVAGSTRGTVACGATRCAVPREICVLKALPSGDGTPTWQCLPRDRAPDGEESYACDDASDCADGQACCLGFESASVVYACSVRSGARANCALESCVEAGGAPCPSAQVCRAGACVPADAGATCNGGQRCPPPAPICVWARGVAICTSERERSDAAGPAPNELRMSCASNHDCGIGLRCCTNALGNATSCRVNCDLANNLELCARDADCSAESSQTQRCLSASAQHPGHFPAWVRVCGER